MEVDDLVERVVAAPDWNARVALIRTVPEAFGSSLHRDVYARIAERAYVPHLVPDFAFVHWREEYELPAVEESYRLAHSLTNDFRSTDIETLARALHLQPRALLVFRLLVGFTPPELSAATGVAATGTSGKPVSSGTIKKMEAGSACSEPVARRLAIAIDSVFRRDLFPPASPTSSLRAKIEKPDTLEGWASVQRYAEEGVPLPVFLHQRHYGGAFRQLLDATSSRRGDLLEAAVEDLFTGSGVRFVRTGAKNKEELARRFGVTVRPAPDFVVFDAAGVLQAILECRVVNDEGTARDKAARFANLRQEAGRLGGIPLIAVLAGTGWRRASDALGPVVRDTDGRVFTLATLGDMLLVQPFPRLLTQ